MYFSNTVFSILPISSLLFNLSSVFFEFLTLLLSKCFEVVSALLHKDLKGKAPLIEPNLRRNLGKWST
ncbi:hypothetical protein EXE07_11850 [Acinetobacter pittii]|nr:hypothetical protein EXE07_11850 [Acinetobacter pittii]